MGADAYVSVITGDTMNQAYQAAVDAAYHEHGHGGYSGSIKESRGIFLAHPGSYLQWEAEHLAQRLIRDDKVQKWEAVGAVAIAEPVNPREVFVEVDVTGLDWDERTEAARTAVMARAKPGEAIQAMDNGRQKTRKEKIHTLVPKTGTVRKYVVVDQWRNEVASHDSQSAARAHAERILTDGNTRGDTLTVVGKVVRESGEPLLTVQRQVTREIHVYTATLAKPSPNQPTRWAVAGVYSS